MFSEVYKVLGSAPVLNTTCDFVQNNFLNWPDEEVESVSGFVVKRYHGFN